MDACPVRLDLSVPGGASRVLLHCCCAPCSGAIVELLAAKGIEPVIFFSNSNITPLAEYEKRRAEVVRYAEKFGFEVVDDEYDHDEWLAAVKGLENEPERGARCLECFRFRLMRAARYAASRGLTVLTTTLASSRWKISPRWTRRDFSPAKRLRGNRAPRCSGGGRTGGRADFSSAVARLSENRLFTIRTIADVNSRKNTNFVF